MTKVAITIIGVEILIIVLITNAGERIRVDSKRIDRKDAIRQIKAQMPNRTKYFLLDFIRLSSFSMNDIS